MTTPISHKNKLGSGIYTAPDISRILGFSATTINRYLNKYWDNEMGREMFQDTYTWSMNNRIKAVNFYVLIELYSVINLQEMGVSTQKIFKARKQIARDLNVQYPFASAGILSDGKRIWYEHMSNVIDSDGTKQMNIIKIIQDFAKRIDFNSKNHLAERYYPRGKSKCIVVDPHHQFGQPTIKGTNINAEVIFSMYKSGEKIDSLGILYDLTEKEINDAIKFYKRAA